MRVAVAIFVGEDPGDAGGGGGFDEAGLLVPRGADAHCDDEGVHASEGVDEGRGVIIVDFLDVSAGGDGVGARGAGEGGDFVFAEMEQCLGDVFAYLAAGLEKVSGFGCLWCRGGRLELTPTIATVSMWFLKPCGCWLAYCWAMMWEDQLGKEMGL